MAGLRPGLKSALDLCDLIGLNQGSRGPVQVGVTFGKHGVAIPPPGFDGLEGG